MWFIFEKGWLFKVFCQKRSKFLKDPTQQSLFFFYIFLLLYFFTYIRIKVLRVPFQIMQVATDTNFPNIFTGIGNIITRSVAFSRSSRSQMFFKIGVPKNFANFTGKQKYHKKLVSVAICIFWKGTLKMLHCTKNEVFHWGFLQ